MKALLIKARLTVLLLAITGSLHGQSTLITFNTTPVWSSTYSLPNAAHFSLTTGGAVDSAKYLRSAINSAGGGGVRVQYVRIPEYCIIGVSGYLRAAFCDQPWSMNLAFRIGKIPADSFYFAPQNWISVASLSDSTTNGNGNVWTKYDQEFFSGTDTVISIAFSAVADTSIVVGFDQINVNPLVVLPVKLTKFTGQKLANGVRLDWGTSSEVNNLEFGVERSNDGVAFNNIADISGHGNSEEQLFYSYLDHEMPLGNIYYRLRQVDYNGKATYSNTILVKADQEKTASLKVYPNPFSDEFHWAYNSPGSAKYTMRFTDVTGKLIYAKIIENQQEGFVNPGEDLAHGIYILSVEDGVSPLQKMLVAH